MITFEGEATIAKTPKTTDNKDESGSTSFLFVATDRPDKDGEPVTIHLPVVYFDELPETVSKGAKVRLTGYINRRRDGQNYETVLVANSIEVLEHSNTV